MKPGYRRPLPILALVLLAGALPAEAAETSYGYVRSLEGTATLAPAGGGGSEELNLNQPLLGGDRVIVGPRSRLELALADYNLVRLDEGSDLLLEQLAFSADRNDRVTVLRLERGEVQLVVHEQALGDELPRIDTPNATVYLLAPGTYRIAAVDPDWSEIVVRGGEAEVLTPASSARLADGEAVEVEGERVYRASANSEDGLEHWARRLDSDALAATTEYVEPELRYAAAPLARHGAWVSVGGRRGWRPHAAAGWRPYWDGRWAYTPSGLTWVDYQPWGWVTSHYGCWDYAPGFGWTWFPGRAYSPAWVYWYWGPSYAGWCPVGYYTRHYGYHDNWWYRDRFRRGTYGWAGGGWNGFSDWTFCETRRLGDRRLRQHAVPGHHLRDRGILTAVPRGIVTTDTRGLTPDRWSRPEAVEAVLRSRRDARPGAAGGQLPDVSDFVARRELTPDVHERVLGDRPRTAVRIDSRPTVPTSSSAVDPRRAAPPAPGSEGRVAVTRPRVAPPPASPAPARGGTAAAPPAGDAWREPGRRRIVVPRVTGEPTPQAAPAAPPRRTHIAQPRVVAPAPQAPTSATAPRAARPRVVLPPQARQTPQAPQGRVAAPPSSPGSESWRAIRRDASPRPNVGPRPDLAPRPAARPRAYPPPTASPGSPPVRRVVDGIRREARPPAYSPPRPAPRPSAPPAGYGAAPSASQRPAVRSSAPPRPAPQAQPQPQSDSGSGGDKGAARSRRPRSKDGG